MMEEYALFSLAAEQNVLGGLMTAPGKIDDVREVLTAGDFYTAPHQLIYGALCEMSDEGKPIDVITVSDHLSQSGRLDEAEGLAYLVGLAKDVIGTANILSYARAVADKSAERRLLMTADDIKTIVYGEGTPKEKIGLAQSTVLALDGEAETEQEDINQILKRCIQGIEQRFEAKGALLGQSTGFKDLDDMTQGLQPSDLIILAARPSMGKTTLAMNIMEHIVIAERKPGLIFSMEMPAEQLALKMKSSQSGIPFGRIRSGQLIEQDWARLTSATQRMLNMPMVIDDRAGLTVDQMRSKARKLHKKNPLSCIMVDYLQLARDQSKDRVMQITNISAGLKAMAKELKVPVLCLSQLNRSVEQRVNKRPINSDLRDSGSIEQDADLIAFIYRDEYYNEDSPDKGIAEIIISKQRNGETGTIRLATDLAHSKFKDLAFYEQRAESKPSKYEY